MDQAVRTHIPNRRQPAQAPRQAKCIYAWAGPATLPGGTIPLPVLKLTFQDRSGKTCKRCFLLDRAHPQALRSFLECFLGHPMPRLWTLDPKTLVGKTGPLPCSPAAR